MKKISIIICTRNRSFELENCIKSILFADFFKSCWLEVIIIDDDEVEIEFLTKLKTMIEKSGYQFKYFKKIDKPDVFCSRKCGIAHSEGEILLFLDDDTEIEKKYLTRLLEIYENYPEIVGLGRVDSLLKINLLQRIYYKLFFMSALNPGKLSLSNFCYSNLSWIFQSKPFYTDYLIGYNMSFKKSAVEDIKNVTWFEGHSPGEDIYISLVAGLKGKLLIDPNLTVKHFRTTKGRDPIIKDQCQYITNFFRLLRFRNATLKNYIAFFWTIIGLIIRSILKLNIHEFIGNISGIKEIVKILIYK